jgi:hypothetical protein
MMWLYYYICYGVFPHNNYRTLTIIFLLENAIYLDK